MIKIYYLDTHDTQCSTNDPAAALAIIDALDETASNYNEETRTIFIFINGTKHTLKIPPYNSIYGNSRLIDGKKCTSCDLDLILDNLLNN